MDCYLKLLGGEGGFFKSFKVGTLDAVDGY